MTRWESARGLRALTFSTSSLRVIARQSWLFLSASKSCHFVSEEMCQYRVFHEPPNSPNLLGIRPFPEPSRLRRQPNPQALEK